MKSSLNYLGQLRLYSLVDLILLLIALNTSLVHNKKKIKNSLGSLIPTSLVNAALKLAQVNPYTPNNSITREDRLKLIDAIKGIKMEVTGLLGSDKANCFFWRSRSN